MQPKLGKIFVTPDDPKFLEARVEPARDLFSIANINVKQLRDEYIRRQQNYDTTPFDPSGNILRLFPSGITIWSGFPGTGKTTLLRQFICHLLSKRHGVFLASLEEEAMDSFYRLACTALGTNDPSEEGLQWCVDEWHDKLRLWSGTDLARSGHLLAAVRVLAEEGVRHAVIDSLMCLDIHNGDWEAQRQFAKAMRTTVRSSGSHIHLVAHPRKLVSADQEPDLNDVAGAREIGGLADNILFVQRNPSAESMDGDATPMRIKIAKQRYFNGSQGNIEGFFNRHLKQFKTNINDTSVTRYLPNAAYSSHENAAREWWN